jgi:Fe-S-cluster containining protein
MNLPAVVNKTFQELKNQSEFIEIVNFVVKNLKRLNHSDERARFLHQVVEEYNSEVFSHPLVKQLSPCQKGCSACCHTQVSVTEDEARLLSQKIRDGIDVDIQRLKIQMTAGNEAEAFFKLDFETRRCIFLDDQGACRVYEDRPAVCRNNVVLGSPDQCDTREGIKPTRLVRTPQSDMAIYGAYLYSKSNGALPYMVGNLMELVPSQD